MNYCFVAALTKEHLEIYSKDKARRQKLMKGMMMVLWYLLYDEDTQVHGFLYLNDFTGYTMQHFTAFASSSDMKDMMKWQVRVMRWQVRVMRWQVRDEVAGACHEMAGAS